MAPTARVAALLAIAIVAGLSCQAAFGYWSGSDNLGAGRGAAGAATVEQGAAPTVSEAGPTNVVVAWASSGLSNGVPVDGYVVKRYDAATGAEATIGSGCAGTIAPRTCTEPNAPAGNWQYSVVPVFASDWRGLESPKSAAVDMGPGAMTLARTLFGGTVAPLPATVTGTVSGFGPNRAIAFFLDGATSLSGSPAQVEADGTAAISIALPAGIADGPHSLSVRSKDTEASVAILVDNAPPTIRLVVSPAPNGAGWNNTAPVEVSSLIGDGSGSGVAYVKYTDDGSDPRSSSTARYATGPVSVSTITTLKFFAADNAGNESPLETQQVMIDSAPPRFTVDVVGVAGGAYARPASEITGEPGPTYYRGAEAGSLRFQVTPLATGGSAAKSAEFASLPADALGFSFDPSSVTIPPDGPFVSNSLSWVPGATSTSAGKITLSNEAGGSSSFTGALLDDSAAPSGGSVDAIGLVGTGGRYSTTFSLTLNLAKGTDLASGLADGSGPSDLPARLERASAPLNSSDGSCGSYTTFVQVGGNNPVSRLIDTVPTNDSCYLYRYLVSDHVGNVATYASPAIKVQVTLPVALGAVTSFAVLAATTVTSAGVSTLTGDLGVSPGTAMTGFPPGSLTGTMHGADATSNQAQADLGAAYADAAGRSAALNSGTLGGQTLVRGVYKSATLDLAGTLTLDGQNDPSSVFILQAGSTLTTSASSQVKLINGAQGCNVYWQVGSSATLGSSSIFAGNILAWTSISMTAGVMMEGRALAHNGAVTLIDDTISAPPCA
jgi:hypothetical protein